jgi:cell division septation protein DedD
MGAVDKGVAVIFAEGLRKKGFTAFVAPGPNEKIFRVLIGPLPDPASYAKAKDGVDKIGLSTFARKFPN